MSTDGFQRVSFHGRMGSDPRTWWYNDDDGTAKVVPADAIVIQQSELPEAHVIGSSLVAGDVLRPIDLGVDELRHRAASYLALAEYLAAHPPVDEAQVDALHDALTTAARERQHTDAWRDVAIALVRDGWHKDVTP